MIVCIEKGKEGRENDCVIYDRILPDEKNSVWEFSLHMLFKSTPHGWEISNI